MYAIYSLLLTLGFFLLLPFFLLDALRYGKYRAGARQRLGNIEPVTDTRKAIWLHCVSDGETQAARPLARRLRQDYPEHPLVVSTITATGQVLARNVFRELAQNVIYFPFDWSFSVRRSLNHINPAVVLLMETEIWPNFLRVCGERRIPVAIVNGRISERSFRRYRLIRPFIRSVLHTIDLAIMQSEEDAERLLRLGMPKQRIFTSGNLKFDAGLVETHSHITDELVRVFDLNERPLIVAASTHSPEERILVEAFRSIYSAVSTSKPRLLIAPRHPERFAEVAELLQASGHSWSRRTAPTNNQPDVMLLDTIGELPAIYPVASIVFVGGSIAKSGGHNILEPAAVGSCVVTGPHTFNFDSVVREFLRHDALLQLPPLTDSSVVPELARVLSDLLTNLELRTRLQQRARDLVHRNLGATEKTMAVLLRLFEPKITHPSNNTKVQRKKADS